MESNKKSTGLVLSGGGANGLFTIEILKHLFFNILKIENIKIISGVSVGSLIGAMIVQKDFSLLFDIFINLKNKNIYKGKLNFWTLAKSILLKKDFILDIKPLKKLLDNYIDLEKAKKSGIDFVIGVTDLEEGIYKSISLNQFTSNEDYKKAILASCIQPPLWELQSFNYKINNIVKNIKAGSDGGVTNITPIKDVLIDGVDNIIIINASNNIASIKYNIKGIFNILLRVLDVSIVSSFNKDIEQFVKYNELTSNNNIKGKKYYNNQIYQFTEYIDSLDFESIELKQQRIINAYESLNNVKKK